MQQVKKKEKHIFYSPQTSEDDCKWENCGNSELLLTGILDSVKPVYPELAPEIEVDPVEFDQENICFLQIFECCSSEYQ